MKKRPAQESGIEPARWAKSIRENVAVVSAIQYGIKPVHQYG